MKKVTEALDAYNKVHFHTIRSISHPCQCYSFHPSHVQGAGDRAQQRRGAQGRAGLLWRAWHVQTCCGDDAMQAMGGQGGTAEERRRAAMDDPEIQAGTVHATHNILDSMCHGSIADCVCSASCRIRRCGPSWSR